MTRTSNTTQTRQLARAAGLATWTSRAPTMLKTEGFTMEHVWKPRAKTWLQLEGPSHALVRTEPMPDGRYLWQFRKVASYADSVDAAKEFVEAGAEFFRTMGRNPYAT